MRFLSRLARAYREFAVKRRPAVSRPLAIGGMLEAKPAFCLHFADVSR
jgi:hypothetical protein